MPDILRDTSDPALIAAMQENWNAVIRTFGRAAHVEMHDEPDVLWFMAGPENGVHFSRLAAADLAPTFARVRARFAERGVRLNWLTGPQTQPADTNAFLEAQGMKRVGGEPGMALEIAAVNENLPQPHGLSIEAVRDAAALDVWATTESLGFEATAHAAAGYAALRKGIGLNVPGLTRFLGRIDGAPVATSTLLLSAGVAGVYDVSTVPTARRHGVGAAMTLAAVRAARAAGYGVAILQPSDMGRRMYESLGFRVVCDYAFYA